MVKPGGYANAGEIVCASECQAQRFTEGSVIIKDPHTTHHDPVYLNLGA